jgi:hypothetical protein
MKLQFTPLVISLMPCPTYSALLWSDGHHCETMDFTNLADACRAFQDLCRSYPGAVRVIDGKVQPPEKATSIEQ